MRADIPIPGSVRDRLVRAAIEQFCASGYDAVHVGQLSAAAGVTTGALYHHFGGKQELYSLVRADVERRVTDRMEGAPEAAPEADRLHAALLVGFDYVTRRGYARLVCESRPSGPDRIADTLGELAASPALGVILAAGWRVALGQVADGSPPDDIRAALEALHVKTRRSGPAPRGHSGRPVLVDRGED